MFILGGFFLALLCHHFSLVIFVSHLLIGYNLACLCAMSYHWTHLLICLLCHYTASFHCTISELFKLSKFYNIRPVSTTGMFEHLMKATTNDTRSCQDRSGQVRSECLTCTFRASCCSARLSRAQVPAFAA